MHRNSFLKFALAFQAIATVRLCRSLDYTEPLPTGGQGTADEVRNAGRLITELCKLSHGQHTPTEVPNLPGCESAQETTPPIHQLMQREVKDTGLATQSRNYGTTAASGKKKKLH